MSKEIASLPSKAFFQMVHLDCEELKRGLVSKAKNYAEMLLEKMITSLREDNKQSVSHSLRLSFSYQICLLVFKISSLFFCPFQGSALNLRASEKRR